MAVASHAPQLCAENSKDTAISASRGKQDHRENPNLWSGAIARYL
jgi:hypothetical protein